MRAAIGVLVCVIDAFDRRPLAGDPSRWCDQYRGGEVGVLASATSSPGARHAAVRGMAAFAIPTNFYDGRPGSDEGKMASRVTGN